ncbi:hypothetical protein AHF37_05124, partial [Paragonimus kellicotti]
FVLIVIVAGTEAVRNLTCYVCKACPNASLVSKNSTQSGCNWCEKQILNGIVNRVCAKNECGKLPEGFSGKFAYFCCQKDYCNESNHVYPTIVIWSLFIGFWFLSHWLKFNKYTFLLERTMPVLNHLFLIQAA